MAKIYILENNVLLLVSYKCPNLYFIYFYFSVSLLASLPGDKLTKIVDCLEVVSKTFFNIIKIW